jgi:citrate lyase beta subunit
MLGASGSTAIHPSQIEIIHDVFTPSAAEVESASRMLEAFDAAVADGNAAIRYNGQMIDYAQVQRVRGLIERAKSYGVGTVVSDQPKRTTGGVAV